MVEKSRRNAPVLMFARGAVLTIKFSVALKMGNGELGMGNGNWEKPDSFFFRLKMKQ